MLIFLSVSMVALLVWMVLCEIRRGREIKTKLDKQNRIADSIRKGIEETMRGGEINE